MSELKIIKPKPVVSYWKSGDPTKKIHIWRPKLTEVNVIDTKRLTDEFIQVCLEEKHRIYLHINITGFGKTIFEPNIPTVRESFYQLKKLIKSGFPQKQILVCVNPVLPNDNGLNALKLLLRVFTEFKDLRLRFIRLRVLTYTRLDNNKFIIGNKNIVNRQSTKSIMQYLNNVESFWKDYYRLIEDNSTILSIDKGEESLIGIRELSAFGYKNEWFNSDGEREKIINYEKGSRFKPIVNILSGKPFRCGNRCLLCPYIN
jgi:DNA repair photolyase